MGVKCLSVGGVLCVLAASAMAELLQANPEDQTLLLKSLEGPNMMDGPWVIQSDEGYVRCLAAPVSNYFATNAQMTGITEPGEAARDFMKTHSGAFGLATPNVDYDVERASGTSERAYIRLQQTYGRVRVFAAQATVVVNTENNVVTLLSDIMRDTRKLDNGDVSLVPSVTPAEAQAAAMAAVAAEYGIEQCDASSPELVIYSPPVVGNLGHPCLAWMMDVADVQSPLYKDRVLVNAHSGGVALRYPLVHSVKDRKIFDAVNTSQDPGNLMRSEGGPPSGITDVDVAYDNYGHTWDFYWNNHLRDSINGNGMTMSATVRYCYPGLGCPMANAFWTGSHMLFGEGFASALDIVAHELTHGVTQYTSSLVYQNESGAINESFSDIWGEFTELTYNPGPAGDKWLMAEDTPFGAFRNMKNPPEFGDPDTYHGDNWYYGYGDNGGVHINSGVGNKLCYLLTDGGLHNGVPVLSLGISKVADLFYLAQTTMLTAGSSYEDLGFALVQLAYNSSIHAPGIPSVLELNFTAADVENVALACLAVGILPLDGDPLRYLRVTSIENNVSAVGTWANHSLSVPLVQVSISIPKQVTLVRKDGGFPLHESDGTVLFGNAERTSYVDGGLPLSSEWFYGLFPEIPLGNVTQFTRVIIGRPTANPFTEMFTNGTDLAFRQITIRPLVNLKAALDSGRPRDYVNYGDYSATIKTGVEFNDTLPVAKEDFTLIPMADDSAFQVSTPVPFPFFGEFISSFSLSANGFLTSAQVATASTEFDNYPSWWVTLGSHFQAPRISFLFADLDPHSGGQVWARFLDDRVAVTFENVPEYHEIYGNTVQCELFYSGQIRFTYLDLNVDQAIVGVSDGRGIPFDPDDIIASIQPAAYVTSNLSALPGTAPFELEPIASQYVREGQVFAFDARANTAFTPVDFDLDYVDEYGQVVDDLPPEMASSTFGRVDDKTYRFEWTPTSFSASSYSLLVDASAGPYTASQPVTIFVTDVALPPTASSLLLSPSPQARVSQELVATYTFSHPQGLPDFGTHIFWYRNGIFMPAVMNLLVVPANGTQVGDVWNFTVRPGVFAGYSNIGDPVYTFGDLKTSNFITVVADTTPDKNGDGLVNSLDVQMVVNGVLGRSASADGDVDGDGQSTAVDVQHVLNATLGD